MELGVCFAAESDSYEQPALLGPVVSFA